MEVLGWWQWKFRKCKFAIFKLPKATYVPVPWLIERAEGMFDIVTKKLHEPIDFTWKQLNWWEK